MRKNFNPILVFIVHSMHPKQKLYSQNKNENFAITELDNSKKQFATSLERLE